jgi:hypothetical protein
MNLLAAYSECYWYSRDEGNKLLVRRDSDANMPLFEIPRRFKSPDETSKSVLQMTCENCPPLQKL